MRPPRGPRPGSQAAHDRYAAAASYRLAPGSTPAAGAPGPRPPGDRTPAPVLMLHGLGGDSGQLWPYAGGDPARSRLAPDLRAHGATMLVGERRSFTFSGLTRDLSTLLDRLRFPPAVVVGMSMGAGVAARLALQPGLDRFLGSAEYRRVLAQSPTAAASLAGQFRAPHAVRRAVRLIQLPRSTPLRHVRDLSRITVPAVVVGAPSDPQHPFEIARIWDSALPASRLVAAPPRDLDPAGYEACLTGICAQFIEELGAGSQDAGRQSGHD